MKACWYKYHTEDSDVVQNVVIMNTNSCDQFTVMGSIEKFTFICRLYMQKDRVDFLCSPTIFCTKSA